MLTIVVAAGVIFEGGRVLVSQRQKGDHLAGSWEFPGGKVEEGEDPKAAVARELREELGIDVVVGEILDVAFYRYEAANKAVLLLFYLASRTPESPNPSKLDVADFAWWDKASLDPAKFPPADVAVLEKVRARL